MLLVLILGAVLATICRVSSASVSESAGDLPDRIIAMVYLINRDQAYLQDPAKILDIDLFRQVYDMFPRERGDDFHLLGKLTFLSRYCHVELMRGYFCGTYRLPTMGTNIDGYLFVTDWISQGKNKFIVLILSYPSPEQSIVVRIKDSKATVLYDTFRDSNLCKFANPGWNKIHIIHFLKVISPNTFDFIEGSYTSPIRSATYRLTVTASGCVLALQPRK